MGLYDGIKDAAKLVQQADNIELYRKLLDLSVQALDMQAEIAKLKQENEDLKRVSDVEKEIVYYEDAFVTKKSDVIPIKYCTACWVDKRKLIPIQDQQYDNYECPLCRCKIYDMRTWEHRK